VWDVHLSHLLRVTLNKALDYQTNRLYQIPNPNPNLSLLA